MKKLWQKISGMDSHRRNHILMRIGLVLFAALVIYRFVAFGLEQHKSVFNLTRDAGANDTPVSVIQMQQTDGVIYEPLFVNNNRGLVSGMRVALFRAGQKIGDCKIVSVSRNIDLDTGMHVVRTSGCQDGLVYAENKKNGFYIPVSALRGDAVFVVNSGVAELREIVIENRDMEKALIKSGITQGDIVILSNIQNGEKVKIED